MSSDKLLSHVTEDSVMKYIAKNSGLPLNYCDLKENFLIGAYINRLCLQLMHSVGRVKRSVLVGESEGGGLSLEVGLKVKKHTHECFVHISV